jgi:NAD(P)H dehydrogenase (quinone)
VRSAVARLAITGATGRIGGGVARRLAVAGLSQRLIVRDPSRAPRLDGAEIVQAGYGDAAAVRRALDGIETVFMVSASESAERLAEHRSFVDGAVAAGVRRLLYLSFFGAAPDATFTLARDHWATEQHIRASGLSFTFLRDSLYLDFLPAMVGEDGVIRGPAGDGRVAAVAQDDIADVVAAVLERPEGHDGATHDLTGPQGLTLHDVAAALTRWSGRSVTYHPETVEEAYVSRARYGAPDWQLEAWVSTYVAIAAGELAGVSEAVARLAGHRPRTIDDVLSGRPWGT